MLSCIRHHLTFKIIVFSTMTSLVAIIAVAWIGTQAAGKGIKTHTGFHMESVADLKGAALETWAESLLAVASTYVSDHRGTPNGARREGLPWRAVSVLDPSSFAIRDTWGPAPFETVSPELLVQGSVTGPFIKIANELGQPGFVAVADYRVELLGVLTVFVDATSLYSVIAPDSGLGKSGEIRLTEPGTGVTWIFSDRSSKPEAIAAGSERDAGELTTIEGGSGEPLLSVTVQIPGQPLWATAAVSRKEALTDLNRLRLSIIGGGAAALLLAIILSTFLGRGITAPLRRLMDSVAQLQIDSEPQPIPVGSRDEIGLLTEKFNEIAGELYHASQDLVTANEGLVEANEMKSQFLSTVTHELKTPLTSVIAFADLLLRRESDLSARQLQQVDAIRRNGRQLEVLINDLLDISRIQSGSLRIEMEQISLSHIVNDVLESMNPIFLERGQTVDASVPGDEAMVNGDTSRIVQILSNLLSNASKYSPAQSKIVVKLTVDETTLSVTVADSGIGISGADQERLFTPFFRADNVQTKSVPGTGLGLVIARRLTEMHGGHLTMRSELGQGSEFTVMLPRVLPNVSAILLEPEMDEDVEDAA